MEIARNLRAFREYLRISRTAFALAIGIGSERLASYESGRVPLRYEVFSAISRRFSLNPLWLATRLTHPVGPEPFDDSEFQSEIDPKSLFTVVYDCVLKRPLMDRTFEARAKIRRFVNAAQELADSTVNDKLPATEYVPVVESVRSLSEIIGVRLSQHVQIHEIASQTSVENPKKPLTKHSEVRNVSGMTSPMKELLARLSVATKARGKKAALAKLLKIPAPRISEWLHRNYEPSGEVTLRLLEWVTAEEAQQQNAPGDAENTARGKTRSTTSKNENSKSGPGKP